MEQRKEDSTTRMIDIKGVAAEDYLKAKGLRRNKGRTRKTKEQSGGASLTNSPPGEQLSGTSTNLSSAASMSARIGPVLVQKGGAVPAQTPGHTAAPQASPLTSSQPALVEAAKAGTLPPDSKANSPQTAAAPMPPAPSSPFPIKQSGGGEARGGGEATKVILEPTKKKTQAKLLLSPSSGSKKSHQSTKQTRKIKVGLSGMKKRLTRAHKITSDSKQKFIDEIKKILESAKLIRPNKNVPEDIIRNIYKDYMLLRGKAL